MQKQHETNLSNSLIFECSNERENFFSMLRSSSTLASPPPPPPPPLSSSSSSRSTLQQESLCSCLSIISPNSMSNYSTKIRLTPYRFDKFNNNKYDKHQDHHNYSKLNINDNQFECNRHSTLIENRLTNSLNDQNFLLHSTAINSHSSRTNLNIRNQREVNFYKQIQFLDKNHNTKPTDNLTPEKRSFLDKPHLFVDNQEKEDLAYVKFDKNHKLIKKSYNKINLTVVRSKNKSRNNTNPSSSFKDIQRIKIYNKKKSKEQRATSLKKVLHLANTHRTYKRHNLFNLEQNGFLIKQTSENRNFLNSESTCSTVKKSIMNQEPISLFNDYSSLIVASMSCNNKRKLRTQQNRKRVRNSPINENIAMNPKTQTTAQFTFKNLIKLFTGNHNQNNNNKQRDEIDESNKVLVPSALSLSSANNSSIESNSTSSASSTHEHPLKAKPQRKQSRRSSSPILCLKNQVQRQSTLSNISSMKLIKVNLNPNNNNNSNNNGSNNNTYGFTVIGYCPCQIGKVESNSLAQLAGLLVGDIIVKVNGKNVCRATCDSIVKMIKNSKSIQLDLYRSTSKSSSKKLKCKRSMKQQQEIYVNKKQQQHLRIIKQQKENHLKYIDAKNKKLYVISELEKCKKLKTNRPTSRLSFESVLAAANHHQDSSQAYYHHLNYLNFTPNKKGSQALLTNKSVIDHMPSPIPYMPPIISSHEQLINNNNNNNKKSSVTDSDYKTQSCSTDNDAGTVNSSFNNEKEQQPDEQHLGLCEKLLNLEEQFIELMQKGVQQYSRPLRHCMMISPQQHQTLFQNIEKILAISEYQLNQLISQDDSALLDMFNTIGKLYENKMRMSCEAFDIYLNGIEKSFDLLFKLKNNLIPNFSKFLLETQEDISMDLKTFLLLPLYYVGNIFTYLNDVKERTSQTNNDFIFLSNLLSTLEIYVKKSKHILNNYNNGQAKNPFNQNLKQENDDSNYEHQSEEEYEYENEHSGEENTKQENFSSNEERKRLVFVHSSSIHYRQSSHKWKRIKLILLNDRLVLTSRHLNLNKHLTSILNGEYNNVNSMRTVFLNDVLDSQFEIEKKPFEFEVNYLKQMNKTSTMRFRCESNEEKIRWERLFKKMSN